MRRKTRSSLSTVFEWCSWLFSFFFFIFLVGQTHVAQRGNKGKHSHRNHCLTVTVSASARKWICVICPLPEGTEVLMAGLSILVAAFYPISALSQPIQLLLLIAFFHCCLCITGAGFVSEGPAALHNVSLWSRVSLTLIFRCWCVWISDEGVTLCVWRWRVKWYFLPASAKHLSKAADFVWLRITLRRRLEWVAAFFRNNRSRFSR